MLDAGQALMRNCRMWKRIGTSLEKAAYKAAEGGLDKRAIALAKTAEACFWQATGDSDAVDPKNIPS
ncbi:hypothetical protein [Mesorhizobium retamae]|uniref:DUF982 domain-containing protein n=1 Tax=Mesorhizobium retamae TaxID=2912854 RepID=A0ABS9QHZ1_9HYPH|nr:hypothetical protein [Mesorhizobium sp. IRAMC:0171]MCG7507040.1 hypothetical protein [Mesorhizobium sp. IRAMC:0171]